MITIDAYRLCLIALGITLKSQVVRQNYYYIYLRLYFCFLINFRLWQLYTDSFLLYVFLSFYIFLSLSLSLSPSLSLSRPVWILKGIAFDRYFQLLRLSILKCSYIDPDKQNSKWSQLQAYIFKRTSEIGKESISEANENFSYTTQIISDFYRNLILQKISLVILIVFVILCKHHIWL